MKVNVEYILPDDEDLYHLHMNGGNAHAAIQVMWSRLFLHHGDSRLDILPCHQMLIDNPDIGDFLVELEKEFVKIASRYAVGLRDIEV